MQTLAIIKQSALIAGLYLFQSANADNAIIIPSADVLLTTTAAGQVQSPANTNVAMITQPNQQPEKAATDTTTTTTTTEPVLTVTTSEQQVHPNTTDLPTETKSIQHQESTETNIDDDLLSQYIRATPSLASTQTLSELLSQLEKVKEDLERCQDAEMYAVIKAKEAEIKKRLESMNTEYLQYLALMQQAKSKNNTLLYASIGTATVLAIGGAVYWVTQ